MTKIKKKQVRVYNIRERLFFVFHSLGLMAKEGSDEVIKLIWDFFKKFGPTDHPTDRQTDRPTYTIRSSRIK